MKLKKLPLEIGNFVCLFGESELLDHFEDRVWPIFKNNKKIKWNKGEDNAYIFHNFELKKIDGDIYMVGRVIRQMTLNSSQKYDEDKKTLKSRYTKMDDSPSTFFLLRLFDHKLLLLRETTRAPGLLKLEKVIAYALESERKKIWKREETKFKRNRRKKRLSQEERVVLNSRLEKKYPVEHFRITPIASYDLLKTAFKRAKKIKSLEVTLFHTNQEDPGFKTAFLKQLKASKSEIGNGKTTTVKGTIVDNDLGLEMNSVTDVAQDVVGSNGNASFTAKGEGDDGEVVKIKDNEVSIRDSISSTEILSSEMKEKKSAKKLEKYANKKSFGSVKIIKFYRSKILKIFSKIQDN